MSAPISSLESLNGLLAFATAVEAGSFSAAGRRLGLSASAVGKAVDRLELRVGMRLLNRTTRALALTGEGQVLYRHVGKILKDLQDAEREMQLQETTPRGRVKFSIPTVLGRKIVLPAIAAFHAHYPDVLLNISLDDRRADLIEEGVDLALWSGELEDSGLQARRLGPQVLLTCAAPSYLSEHGLPHSPADLVDYCCILYQQPHSGRLEPWVFAGGINTTRPSSSIVPLNDGEALLVAAVAGWGIVQAPAHMLRDDVLASRLQPVLVDYAVDHGSIWLVWPAHAAQVPRVRVFLDFIANHLMAELYPGND